MTEITRVPLQPIAKGALGKLWVGVAAVALAAGGIAWAAMPGGVDVEVVKAGAGVHPAGSDVPVINYVGKLVDGKEFDRGNNVPMPLDGVIPGFRQGLMQMQKGGRYRLEIPAAMAYGAEEKRNPMSGEVVIPANSDLVFEIDVIDILSQQQFEQMMRMQQMMQMQQMQQMQQGGGSPPPGAIPPQP